MGQEFSKEDFDLLNITPDHTPDPTNEAASSVDSLDALLEEIIKQIGKYRLVASPEFVFYTRHRMRCGAPSINRWSYSEEELRKFEDLNDGFPVAATVDEMREFDRLLVTGKSRKQKKKQRSRSFTCVVSEASRLLPALSRPRFVDKIITGYSSLTRRSSGKQKKYQSQLSLDQSRSCYESLNSSAIEHVLKNDFEITVASGDVKFCSKCDLPILFEDVNNCLVYSEGSEFMCFTCYKERSSQHISEESVLSENVDDRFQLPTAESSQCFHQDQTLKLLNQTFSELSLSNNEEFYNRFERTNKADPDSLITDPWHAISGQDSPIFSNDVRQQCDAPIQSSPSHNDSSFFDHKLPALKSECTVISNNLPLRHLQKRTINSQTEQTNQWPKNYYSLARDNNFSQAVMAKGYVKALADQINQQGTLKQARDEDNEIDDTNSEMSMSTSSVTSCKNDEIPSNLVHSLILAAEQQKFKDDSPTSPARKPDLPANNDNSNNSTDPNGTMLLNSHPVTDFNERSSCGPSLSSTNDKLSFKKDNELIPVSGPSITSCSSLTLSQDMNSITTFSKSSPNSPPEISPLECSSPSQFPTKALRSPGTPKPAVNYARKPKISAKPSLTTTASLNAQTSPSTPLTSASPSVFTFSPKAVTPPKQLTTLPSTKCSPKSPTTPNSKTTTPLPKSASTSPLKSPAVSPKTQSFKSPIKPSINLRSPSLKTPSFIALTIDPLTPSPTSPIKSSPKSRSTSPLQTPKPTALKPNENVSQQFTSSHHSNEFKYETQSSTKSNSQTGTVEQWLSDSHNSLTAVPHNDEVCLRPVSKRSSDQYRDSVFKTIYDNHTPLNAAELFDSSWSDSDSFNGVSDDDEDSGRRKGHRSGANVSEQLNNKVTDDQASVHLKDRRQKIAEELLQTERDYVARLYLLHNIFYFRLDNENRQQVFLPPDTLKHMFSNTKSIFLFHNDFLLPQLGDRMDNWENDPRIGDLLKKNAPFLKMYTEYIRNFDKAMKLINLWMEKSAKFSEIIQDIQKMPECHNLSLQHHMLGPIQRVPRYELLLKDYVKHLPEDSPDMSDAKDALDLVTKAACHSNEAMKKIETFHKLLDIYQSLRGVPVDFISPTREFVTQGPVTKIAARSGEKQPRQIFLFNDLVLICTQYNLLGTYSIRSQLEVDGMEIKPGASMNIPNTFLVHGKQRAVELLDENPTGEPVGWHEKIQIVISNYKKRKRSIKHEEPKELALEPSVPESCLGKTAPVWIQDDAATMCMLCMMTFTMVRRRHHCRACGKLICKTCCKKAPLEYNQGKIERVCITCYDVIVNKRSMINSDSSDGKTSPKKKGILHVNASTGLISGYMHCSDDGGHNWQKLWVTAHKDFVLYTFRAHEDVSAISSLPLPGYEVNQLRDIPGRHYAFCICHKKKRVMMFQTDHDKHLKRWLSVLTKLAQAQLPDENSRLSSQSNSSNSSSVSDNGTLNNGISPGSNKRSSTHSGSQADSGYPGDSNNSLSALAVDDNDHEVPDRILQSDNMNAVYCE